MNKDDISLYKIKLDLNKERDIERYKLILEYEGIGGFLGLNYAQLSLGLPNLYFIIDCKNSFYLKMLNKELDGQHDYELLKHRLGNDPVLNLYENFFNKDVIIPNKISYDNIKILYNHITKKSLPLNKENIKKFMHLNSEKFGLIGVEEKIIYIIKELEMKG